MRLSNLFVCLNKLIKLSICSHFSLNSNVNVTLWLKCPWCNLKDIFLTAHWLAKLSLHTGLREQLLFSAKFTCLNNFSTFNLTASFLYLLQSGFLYVSGWMHGSATEAWFFTDPPEFLFYLNTSQFSNWTAVDVHYFSSLESYD